jgi:predicted RNA-binding Zn-ribbon protein involved in translation (DUF1610 family)
MQVSEQEDHAGSREGKNRTRVADHKRKMMVAFSGNKNPHPTGWTAFCKSVDEVGMACTAYAQFRCPQCKKPVCTGCAREFHDMAEDVMEHICGNCWEAL